MKIKKHKDTGPTGIKYGTKTVWFPATRPPDTDRDVQVYVSQGNLKYDPDQCVFRPRQDVACFRNGAWTQTFVTVWSELRSDPGFCVTDITVFEKPEE